MIQRDRAAGTGPWRWPGRLAALAVRPLAGVRAAAAPGWRPVSACAAQACAVEADGQAGCWGDDTLGQTRPPAALGVVHQVSARNAHSCAVRAADDRPVCRGWSSARQTRPPPAPSRAGRRAGRHATGTAAARAHAAPHHLMVRRLAAAILLGLLLVACRSGPPAGPASPGLPPGAAAPRPPAGDRSPLTSATPGPAPAAVDRSAPPAPPPAAAADPMPPAARVALVWATDDTPAALDRPTAVALGRHGDLYVVDAGHARLAVFDRDGRFRRAWGGPGGGAGQFNFLSTRHCPGGYRPDTCPPEAGGSVAVDDQDRVYVVDSGNHRVQVFDADGRLLIGWGREGTEPGEFRLPRGIAVDGQGRVSISDGENHRVQVFDRNGRLLTLWGGPGGGEGQFRHPGALALDGRGRLAVADRWDDRVQLFDPDGRFLAAWRAPGGGPAAAGLAFTADGGLVVAGAAAEVEQRDEAGWLVRSWRADWRGQGALVRPAGVAVDAAGDIYIADASGGRVAKFRVLTPVTR